MVTFKEAGFKPPLRRAIADWLGYRILMWLPTKWMDTRFGLWCLEHAGNHAYWDRPYVARNAVKAPKVYPDR